MWKSGFACDRCGTLPPGVMTTLKPRGPGVDSGRIAPRLDLCARCLADFATFLGGAGPGEAARTFPVPTLPADPAAGLVEPLLHAPFVPARLAAGPVPARLIDDDGGPLADLAADDGGDREADEDEPGADGLAFKEALLAALRRRRSAPESSPEEIAPSRAPAHEEPPENATTSQEGVARQL